MRIFTYFNVQHQKHRVIVNKMNREEVTSSFPHLQYHTFHEHHLQVEIHSKSHEPTNFLKKNLQNLWNQDSMNIKRNGFIFGAKLFQKHQTFDFHIKELIQVRTHPDIEF